MSVCIFGDSIVWGAFDSEDSGWIARLNKGFKYHIYNLGISTDDTTRLLRRLKPEALARRADVILIGIGSNDSAYVGEPSNMIVPIKRFKDNLLQLIKIAKGITDKVAFLGFFPVDESKTLPWISGYYYTVANYERYNNMIKEVCAEHGVQFVDIYAEFIKTDYKKLLHDGLHPNSNGHAEIAKRVGAFLKEKGWFSEEW